MAELVPYAKADSCDETRTARVAELVPYAKAEVSFRHRTDLHVTAIASRYSVPTTRRLENDYRGPGLRIQTNELAPVCRGGNPGGLSVDDVNLVLHRLSPYADGGDLPIRTDDASSHQMNMGCMEADKAAGLTLIVPTRDVKGLEALIGWKP